MDTYMYIYVDMYMCPIHISRFRFDSYLMLQISWIFSNACSRRSTTSSCCAPRQALRTAPKVTTCADIGGGSGSFNTLEYFKYIWKYHISDVWGKKQLWNTWDTHIMCISCRILYTLLLTSTGPTQGPQHQVQGRAPPRPWHLTGYTSIFLNLRDVFKNPQRVDEWECLWLGLRH